MLRDASQALFCGWLQGGVGASGCKEGQNAPLTARRLWCRITRYQLVIWGVHTVQTSTLLTFLRIYTEELQSSQHCSDADDAEVSASDGRCLSGAVGRRGRG